MFLIFGLYISRWQTQLANPFHHISSTLRSLSLQTIRFPHLHGYRGAPGCSGLSPEQQPLSGCVSGLRFLPPSRGSPFSSPLTLHSTSTPAYDRVEFCTLSLTYPSVSQSLLYLPLPNPLIWKLSFHKLCEGP